jgi:hypothetical protein
MTGATGWKSCQWLGADVARRRRVLDDLAIVVAHHVDPNEPIGWHWHGLDRGQRFDGGLCTDLIEGERLANVWASKRLADRRAAIAVVDRLSKEQKKRADDLRRIIQRTNVEIRKARSDLSHKALVDLLGKRSEAEAELHCLMSPSVKPLR